MTPSPAPPTRTTLDANLQTARLEDADPRVLILAAADNVGTAIADLAPGTSLNLRGKQVTSAAVPMGHKIAVGPIAAGEKIVKYGAPIGSATRAIAPGEHVHTQNMKSDYLPSFGRDGSSRMSSH